MSVEEQTPYNQYIGNGVSTVFAYQFQILDQNDLAVYVGAVLQVRGTDYGISGVGSITGGQVTFAVAPGSGIDVLIFRSMTLERDTDYQTNGDLREVVLDRDFNRLWMAIQGQQANMFGSLRLPFPEVADPLPPKASRAGGLLGFDSVGKPSIYPGAESLLESAERAEAAAYTAEAAASVAVQAKNDAVAAAGAIGPIKFYSTYAQAVADIASVPVDGLVEISQDETHAGARTRYFKRLGNVLEFAVNLDQLRLDLAKTTGAKLVGIAYGGTVQDALLFVTPQMHTSTAGTGSDDSAALQWAFDSGLPVQLGGFSYKTNKLLTSVDKTISINGNDAKILCTAAGGVDIKLRPGEDYFFGTGFRVIADGALSGDGLHVWSATSVAHGSPSVQLNNVYVSRSDVANGFNRAFFLENVFQTTLNNLHIRGSTFGAVFDSCVSVSMLNPDIVFSDTGFKTLATNRGCEGFRLNGGFIYNNRVSMDVFRVLDIQLQGTHLLGREKILRIERSFQSSFSGAVWYCDTFDGTERDLISSHDTVQSVRFTDITVELVGPALGHHNAFVANSGFIQNSITACRFRNLTLNSGANDNVVTSVILEKTGGVTNLTDNGLRNKKIGIFGDGVSSLDFSYSGTTQLRLSPNLVTVETPMTVKSVTDFYNVLDLHQSDATTVTDYDARISISNATGVNAGGMITLAAVNIRPSTDGGMDVGTASRRFNTFFGVNGAINISDGRYKTEPQSIPDSWLDAAGDAGPELWKWLDSVALKGELARTHCGPIAQHLVDAFVRHGVMEEGSTDSPFGGLCYDEWEDEYEPVMGTRQVEYADTDGNLVLVDEKYDTGEKRLVTKAGNRWSIRPDQCLWLRMAWMDREHKLVLGRVERLEQFISANSTQ